VPYIDASRPFGFSGVADQSTVSDFNLKDEKKNTKRLGIVNGNEVDSSRYPYMVAWTSSRIIGKEGIRCGGSLIAEDLVLTAAHCQSYELSKMQIGRHNLYDSGEDDHEEFYVTEQDQYPHELYGTGPDINYDFMIVKLRSSSSYEPVAINLDDVSLFGGEILHVTGWGTKSSGGEISDVLMYVDLFYETNEVCQEKYFPRAIITNRMLCASDVVEGQDSCQGDSGGPLIIPGHNDTGKDDIQVGVVSWGFGCADPLYPGVYARISSVQFWITQKVCSLSKTPPSQYNCEAILANPVSTKIE